MKQLLYLTAAFLAGCIATAIFFTERRPAPPTTETGTAYDTIRHYVAVPRDSVALRYETHWLPIAAAGWRPAVSQTNSPSIDQGRRLESDSSAIDQGRRLEICSPCTVEVAVPITQKEYADSTYHAWVSGYAVSLDSIHTYTRHDYTTVRAATAKPKRWHVGPAVGVGWTGHGFQPYAGVSITYSLISF